MTEGFMAELESLKQDIMSLRHLECENNCVERTVILLVASVHRDLGGGLNLIVM